MSCLEILFSFFFFNDTATTEIYTLSLHDALPISELLLQLEPGLHAELVTGVEDALDALALEPVAVQDRKSTRLNSSHANISYAVFCLKKKKRKCVSSSYTWETLFVR